MVDPEDTPPSSAKRIFLHVGAPKTGTTYLQNVLLNNRRQLARDGVLWPYTRRDEPFRAMLSFRGVGWGSLPASTYKGDWERIARRARLWRGHTVLISNELLGGSLESRIASGVESLADPHGRPTEVHVIFTARDFARQLVSDWQEQVKHKHTVTLDDFVEDLMVNGFKARRPFGELFWGMHDAAHVLARWETVVPRERIHVIALPRPGAPGGALWSRFCNVVGLDPEAYDTTMPRDNASMGVAETELVRRINNDLKPVGQHHYDALVRQHLAQEVLGNQSGRLTLPPRWMPDVVARSEQLVEQLKAADYAVQGDLADLVPDPADHQPHVSPSDVPDAEIAEAALRATVAMVKRSAHLRNRIHEASDLPSPDRPSLARRAARRARNDLREARDRMTKSRS